MLLSKSVKPETTLVVLLQIIMQVGTASACCVIYVSVLLTFVAEAADYKLTGDGTAIRTEFVPTTVTTRAWDGSVREPSCDELRAMWRFSKRQSRATEITNEVPTYRDPFAYNIWEPYARPRSVAGGRGRGPGRNVYGRILYTAPRSRSRDHHQERYRPYEEVAARLIGTGHQGTITGIPRRKVTSFRSRGTSSPADHVSHLTPQAGSRFEMVKDLIQKEKARELHEQRMADEAAARAAALKGQMYDSSYGQIIHEPPTHPGANYEALRYGEPGFYDENMHLTHRNGRLLTLHDPLPPTATQYADQDVHLYNHRSYPDMIPVSDIYTLPRR